MSRKTRTSAYITVSAVLVSVVLLIGMASGHFESKTERNVSLLADPLYRLYLAPAEDSGNWYEREFILSNVDLSPAQEPEETPPAQVEEDDPQAGEQSSEEEPQEEPAENGENDPGENEEEGGAPADPGEGDPSDETPQEEGDPDTPPESEEGEEPSQNENPQQETPQSEPVSTPSQADAEADRQRRIALLPEMNARVTLLCSLGIGDAEQLSVTIRSGDREYTGVPEKIAEGTELYRLFGPGWQFTFFDPQDRELTWAFAKGQVAEHHFTVSVRAAQPIPYDSMLQLIATTV